MPGRKQPFTPAMWARIEALPEGTPLAGRPNWSPSHRHRDRSLLRLGRVLWSTGHRLGEIVWHPSGQVHYTTERVSPFPRLMAPRSLFRQPPTDMPLVQVIVSCLPHLPPNLISSARSIVRSQASCPTMETTLVPPLLSATLNWSPPARPTCGAKRPCSPTSRDIPSRTPCYMATYVRCWMRFSGVPSH